MISLQYPNVNTELVQITPARTSFERDFAAGEAEYLFAGLEAVDEFFVQVVLGDFADYEWGYGTWLIHGVRTLADDIGI
jgi:hypothetical protein